MAKKENVPATASEARGMVNPFDVLQSRIDRMFSDFNSTFGMPKAFWDDGFRMPAVWGGKPMPSLEMHDADGKVTVTAELPGVEEKDIDVSVDDDMLTISGEKKSEFEEKEGEGYRSERSYGKFSRSVSLGFTIDPAKVEARFEQGVLKLTIAKPAGAAAKAKKIPIKH